MSAWGLLARRGGSAMPDAKARAHICVYDVGSDECLICGAKAALVGQQPVEQA